MEFLADLMSRTNLVAVVNANDWLWPLCEILHFFGMAVLIGTVGIVDVRILGFGKSLPIAQLEKFVPLGVAAFFVNAATGFVFVAGNPVGGPLPYLENLALQIKMLLVLLAGINLLVFYFTGIAEKTDSVSPSGEAPVSAKMIAGTSLVLWFGVIFFGRLIMYNDTLLYALGM